MFDFGRQEDEPVRVVNGSHKEVVGRVTERNSHKCRVAMILS